MQQRLPSRGVCDRFALLGMHGQHVGVHAPPGSRLQRQSFADGGRLHMLERPDLQPGLRNHGELRPALPPRDVTARIDPQRTQRT
jgi:hypothetical protein